MWKKKRVNGVKKYFLKDHILLNLLYPFCLSHVCKPTQGKHTYPNKHKCQGMSNNMSQNYIIWKEFCRKSKRKKNQNGGSVLKFPCKQKKTSLVRRLGKLLLLLLAWQSRQLSGYLDRRVTTIAATLVEVVKQPKSWGSCYCQGSKAAR